MIWLNRLKMYPMKNGRKEWLNAINTPVLKMRDLQSIVAKSYRAWLKKHGGKRPRKPTSTHTAVSALMLAQYEDNWKLIK